MTENKNGIITYGSIIAIQHSLQKKAYFMADGFIKSSVNVKSITSLQINDAKQLNFENCLF